MADSTLLLALELPGTGVHPASWRRPDSRAEDLFTGGYWADAVTAAEKAGVDAVFLPDSFGLQPGGPGVTRGRLDAVAIAARVAAATHGIALLPQAAVTHTEPFHLSKAIASLDFATLGRAGWEVTVSATEAEAKAFGRKEVQDARALWHEADEAIEVATRLWDSWEDDAEIRDVPTGRFIDRDKLHYIDFDGDNFSVKGPSITPRSPQGQPIVAVRAGDAASTAVAVRRADLVRITAATPAEARIRRDDLRAALRAAGRDPETVRILLDLDVHLADSVEAAAAEIIELDQWAAPVSTPEAATAPLRHLGTTAGLRVLLDEIAAQRVADGVVLRPLALRPVLARLPGLERNPLAHTAFRHRLGLPRPVSRYATAPSN
ncbi:LLM class flavin-dependent oxidoreductase [Nocardia goodfellowii]|uniref:Alkanesulfonate monooxygenase SsuD/methylene tetrahydromethanopterin reductase-like flavin-dependent oxidoreductase (Luciferase family) n=1 Tax=Nocardia goodfellowii TaxID=882446 RepID=A0ABS4QQ06_9NOCA|nr:LLM class flavin-dependent oxidoreductase [Nocardia goodfellowii]MBP2193772.1 alkanesulfonate monooxygenase SsuD/methylene tetrahydromethanopterin reductase-like flavin-dependent oxidoreductase (luciferase family) [Nocardia goodfellowii]